MSGNCMTARHSNIGVMWKTVSEDCNLACDYCYYSTCGGKPGPKINRIDSAILDKFIKDYMEHSQAPPTLPGRAGNRCWPGWSFLRKSFTGKRCMPRRIRSSATRCRRTPR